MGAEYVGNVYPQERYVKIVAELIENDPFFGQIREDEVDRMADGVISMLLQVEAFLEPLEPGKKGYIAEGVSFTTDSSKSEADDTMYQLVLGVVGVKTEDDIDFHCKLLPVEKWDEFLISMKTE